MSLDKLYFAIAMLLAVIVDWYLAKINSPLFTELVRTATENGISSNRWLTTFYVWWYTTVAICVVLWGVFIAGYSVATFHVACILVSILITWLDREFAISPIGYIMIFIGNVLITYGLMLITTLLPNPLGGMRTTNKLSRSNSNNDNELFDED